MKPDVLAAAAWKTLCLWQDRCMSAAAWWDHWKTRNYSWIWKKNKEKICSQNLKHKNPVSNGLHAVTHWPP